MRIAQTYRSINRQLLEQYREPVWGWGFRLAVSITAPLVYGIVFNKVEAAVWMSIAAESAAFIELKGTPAQRFRILLSALLLVTLFCTVGSAVGNIFWLQIAGLFVIGFLSGLFKNLGERGMGLALSVYITYIITSSYPVKDIAALEIRVQYVFWGGAWALFVGVAGLLFVRAGRPYRTSIANIWQSLSSLADVAGKGLDLQAPQSSVREIYLKEKDLRSAIDSSLNLFQETADAIGKSDKAKYAWVQSRKSASLVGLLLIQMSEAAQEILKRTNDKGIAVLLHSIFRAIGLTGGRMQQYLLSLKEEEKVLVHSRLRRLAVLNEQLNEQARLQDNPAIQSLAEKITLLSGRLSVLAEHSLQLLSNSDEQRVIRSYSLAQTMNILHPNHFINNVKLLFNIDSYTTRYAVRIGCAAFLGGIIAHLFFPHYGYWVPFTAIIVSQPYFGATLKKGLERTGGTLAGIIAGSGILMLPSPLAVMVGLVFFTSFLIIYFLRKRYSVSAFFITLMLVGLLSIEPNFQHGVLVLRLICTLIGSALAITAGFVLLPTWDKKVLPKYIAEALLANYKYFQNTFYYGRQETVWTKKKRVAETKNGNAFDSLLRFMQEPLNADKKNYALYYQFLTHNIRITREMNNYNSEQELEESKIPIPEKEKFIGLLYQCDDLFRSNLQYMASIGKSYIEESEYKVFPTEGFTNTTPSKVQLVFIEKLFIELRAIQAVLPFGKGTNKQ